jgi:chromosome segregation ATPase
MTYRRRNLYSPLPKDITKEQIHLLCMEETIRDLPRIQHEMQELQKEIANLIANVTKTEKPIKATFAEMLRYVSQDAALNEKHVDYYEMKSEYEGAMRVKREYANIMSWDWAEYIHQSAILDFYSNMIRK